MSLALPELKALISKTEAEKLARKRKRHARRFAHLCEVLRELDRKIGTSLLHCTPQVREAVRADTTAQDELMIAALTKRSPSPHASLTQSKSSR